VSGATVAGLRRDNLSRALTAVHRHGHLGRAELTQQMGVARNTTAGVVGDLVRWGLVEEVQAVASGRPGRPTGQLAPGPASPVAVAVEVSPEAVRAALVGLGRQLLDVREEALVAADAPSTVAQASALVAGLVSGVRERCAGVGVALYGLVDDSGTVRTAPNLGWRQVPLQPLLTTAVPRGLPVVVANDASLAAVHEARYGAGRGARTCLYLYGATGVGGGLTIDGDLVTGRQGHAGEVGHMLINPSGRRCRCGRTGCWESEVDRGALRRRWARDPTAASDAEAAVALFTAQAAGEPGAVEAVDATATWLGEGIGSLLNVLDPDRVVLAGELADLYRAAPDRLLDTAARRRLAPSSDLASLVVTSQDRDAALLGAAERVLQPALTRPDLFAAGSPLTP
jgi:predicted NBD/HSP70 family sugar kinase